MKDNEVIEKVLARKVKKTKVTSSDFLSSGSTLVNLACSGRTRCCYRKGHYYWFVGDSESGKTFLALTAFAEAAINPAFDDYRLIYDNSENGALMNMKRYFGKRVADRLEPPNGTRENPIYSKTAEDMYYSIFRLGEAGHPFIFIEDSMDVLKTRAENVKLKKQMGKRKAGDEGELQVGAKAAINSAYLPKVIDVCKETKSIVIIISQVRDNLGFGAKFNPDRIAGGRALKFYCTLMLHTKIKEKIKRKIRGKMRAIGMMSKVQIKKNRVQGKDRTVYVPIYNSVGVDDIGSCIDYLIEEKHWKGTEENVTAPEFDYAGNKEGLITQIEESNREQELRSLIKEVWDSIEEDCKVKRKNRYA